jgi:hypothetical protein
MKRFLGLILLMGEVGGGGGVWKKELRNMGCRSYSNYTGIFTDSELELI